MWSSLQQVLCVGLSGQPVLSQSGVHTSVICPKHSDSQNTRWPSPKAYVRHFLCLHLHCSQDSSVSSQRAVVEHSRCSKEFTPPSHKGGGGERKGKRRGGKRGEGEGATTTTKYFHCHPPTLGSDDTCINYQCFLITLLIAKSLLLPVK